MAELTVLFGQFMCILARTERVVGKEGSCLVQLLSAEQGFLLCVTEHGGNHIKLQPGLSYRRGQPLPAARGKQLGPIKISAGSQSYLINADFQEIPVQLLIKEERQQLKSGRIRTIFKELDKNVPQNMEC